MLRPFVFPRLIVADGDRRRPRSQPPDQARARPPAPTAPRRGLRPQERRGRDPRDRVLRPGAAADPRRQAARSCAAAARSPRSMRCCSRAWSPTTSTSRCGAPIAGCATPSTCSSSRAGCRPRPSPRTTTRRAVFARRLGYRERRGVRARARRAHRRGVAAVRHARRSRRDERAEISAILARRARPSDEEAAALTRLGFVDVTAARAELARARRKHGLAAVAGRDRARPRGSAPRCSPRSRRRADPDQALRYLGDLIARRGEAWSIWRLLDENPPILRLRRLAARRERVPRAHARRHAGADRSARRARPDARRRARARRSPRDLAARLAAVDASDPEAVWSAIAEVKNGHVLRVGLADFAGALDPLAVCDELTAIAEACLGQALAIVEAQLVERHGRPPGDARLAVLGLGKLGGRELGYAADLDVVFVLPARRGRVRRRGAAVDDRVVLAAARSACSARSASARRAAGSTRSTRGCARRARRACS